MTLPPRLPGPRWLLAVLLAATAATAATPARADSLTDGDTYGTWTVAFAGYGSVTASGSGARTSVRLRPAVADDPGKTHAALVLSTSSFTTARFKARVQVDDQLRTGSASNPWETGWLVTRYTDNDHFYYLALKTNGWELGKRDPAYPGGQRFLATGGDPRITVGSAASAQLLAKGNTLTVRINGTTVTRFTDTERPYERGRVGMYCEDADVRFDRLSVTTG